MNLNDLIREEKLGYSHKFGDKMIISREMVKDCGKSTKTEGKYFIKISNEEEEIVDYLTSRDLLALQDGKCIECTWVKSRNNKPYWNHSSKYLDEVVEEVNV